MSRRIHVGDEWIEVPDGYIQAEKIYTDNLNRLWFMLLVHGITDEKLRQRILDKRVEFHQRFKEGSIVIPPKITITHHTPWWKKMWRRING